MTSCMLMMQQMITDKEIMETDGWHLETHWLHFSRCLQKKNLWKWGGTHWLHVQQMSIGQEFMEIVGWQGDALTAYVQQMITDKENIETDE